MYPTYVQPENFHCINNTGKPNLNKIMIKKSNSKKESLIKAYNLIESNNYRHHNKIKFE